MESKEGTETQRKLSDHSGEVPSVVTHTICIEGFLAEQSKNNWKKGSEQWRTKLADYLYILNTRVSCEELQEGFMTWTN